VSTEPIQTAPPLPSGTSNLLDDFEGTPPSGTSGWEGYFQDNTDTRISCSPKSGGAHNGAAYLEFDFDVTAGSWATCGFYFDTIQNWSRAQGLSFYLRADQANLPFEINMYGGSPGGHTTYYFRTQTPPGTVNNWTLMDIRWDQILRAEWEDDPGKPFNPAEVTGFSIGVSTPEGSRSKGAILVDDLSLLGAMTSPDDTSTVKQQDESGKVHNPLMPCGSVIILPLALVVVWPFRRVSMGH
jgi:hypothetical protein